MQVLAEAASREAELQPRSNKHQQLVRRLAAPMPRIHTLNKTQLTEVNQLITSKQTFTGQKIVSPQAQLNHKNQQTTNATVQSHIQQTFKQVQTKLSKQPKHSVTNTNVLKSSSLPNIPNISKFPVNSNLLLTAKQQQVNVVHQQVQRSHNTSNARMQSQQQMLLKVGVSNKVPQQNLQTGSMKNAPGKMINVVKTLNQQKATIQQPMQRGHPNIQSIAIVQQQQSIVGLQNTQKQPGCIKTLTPQKQTLKNHSLKNLGIKTSLNTNMSVMKPATAQVMPLNIPIASTVQQKGNMKTLQSQQSCSIASVTGALSGGSIHKNSNQTIKIQQQTIQQKQLMITASTAMHYAQSVRPQFGQIKTLLPIGVSEPRKENELKIEIKDELQNEIQEGVATTLSSLFLQSPQRRMPLPYECLQFVLQDHNYGAPPPRTPPPQSPPPHTKQQPINGAGNSCISAQHSYIFNQVVSNTTVEDDATSAISSEIGREVEPEGEETETAPEGEGDDEDSITRCICDFEHDDGYMICCDRCLVWQHVDCMGIDRANIPDEYLCEVCRPRRVDRARARALQMRKREELLNSDTSSDSSTSSVDTDVGQNTSTKNRKASVQQQSISQRKSDTPLQVRRLNNNNNNNNVAKRQRRDTHPRQTNAVRSKKESIATSTTATTQTVKQQRGPLKRKPKRRTSLEDKEDETQDAWGSNMAPLRQWIERYEEAVTNHYSPELRARISSIKVNGTHNDMKQSNIGATATGKCRLNIQSNNLRFLVATMYLPSNTPVVELRGKYMLSTQHRPSHLQGRQHTQRPGPFVFFYRLPRDGTEVCVDTRTYGNDARFVRRSCKPNAEVKHCIEKGTLHLYIVTSLPIEKNAEITIRHDQHDIMLSPNSNSSIMPITCACNNLRDCQITSLSAMPMNKKGSNGPLTENTDGRERRRRGRRNTTSEENNETSTMTSTAIIVATNTTTPSITASTIPAYQSPKKSVTIISNVNIKDSINISVKDSPNASSVSSTNSTSSSASSTPATTRQIIKEEHSGLIQPIQPNLVTNHAASKVLVTSPNFHSITSTQTISTELEKDKKKMTREERKMEAIMKAFERLEKAEQRKQEVQARNAQRKESGGPPSDNEDSNGHVPSKSKSNNTDKTSRRKRRKGRTRSNSTSQNQNMRRTRLNSAESDMTSGDESNSMQSPPLHNQSYSLRIKEASDSGDPIISTDTQVGIPTAAGLLLALANSSAPGSSSPPQQQSIPIKSPTCDSGASSSSQSSTPSTPLSSACLLVAAAVGPLAPDFKFPKTKKLLMNEWLKESPEPQLQIGDTRTSEFACSPEQSSEILSQNYAVKSLATLVQAAHSVSGIGESTPQRGRQITLSSVSTGSAKKRWLRQAISEECDSPNSCRPESPPSEMVAPPKKRRIARESLSSDNYTPPSTPTMIQQDHISVHRCSINEDDFVEQLQSPNNEDLESQTEYDSDQVKDEIKSRFSVTDQTNKKCKINSCISLTSEFINDEKKSILSIKMKEESKSEDENISLNIIKNHIKSKKKYIKVEYKSELKPSMQIKTETHSNISETLKAENKYVKIEEIIQTGTVEIIDQNEQDLEADDLSSPIATMESDAELKQRVAELRLEFGGTLEEHCTNDIEKSFQEQTDLLHVKSEENKFDGNISIDEYDVEAQMKKITGDDGDDYKEKVEISLERGKSIDGIEGLMESSKEDSDSDPEERDINDFKETNKTFKESYETTNVEERIFKEFECKHKSPIQEEFEVLKQQKSTKNITDKESLDSIERELNCSELNTVTKEIGSYHDDESIKQDYKSASIITPEESMMELDSMELPSEEISEEPAKFFSSIPPLSERIRKKVDSVSILKSKLKIETSIVESSLDVNIVEDTQNIGQNKMLSSALQELLEAEIESEDMPITKIVNKNQMENTISVNFEINVVEEALNKKNPELCIELPRIVNQQVHKEVNLKVKKEEPLLLEYKRLKDPRTVVPNKMPNPSPTKNDGPPVKRKLSISEYRKRKQQSSGTPPEPENLETLTEGKSINRDRSDSASSSTSSLSSDDEGIAKQTLDIPNLSTLPIFANADSDEKKGGDEGTIGWSAAPTLVERQRENLTERLKREFGLFLNDDEEERVRKQGLSNCEPLLKSTNVATGTAVSVGNTGIVGYPVTQLPPQPYIPPPGSASIHYSQYSQVKLTTGPQIVQYPGYPLQLPSIVTSGYPANLNSSTNATPQQFAITQAPPGANPYPPGPVPLLVTAPPPPPPPVPPPVPPPTTTSISIMRYSPATTQATVPTIVVYPLPPSQSHKNFYNHSASRS